MTNQEKLFFSMGEIDDELIAEASSKYKKRPLPMLQGLTVAASLILISVAVITAAGLFSTKSFDSNMSGGDAAPPSLDLEDGCGSNGIGSLEGQRGFIRNIVRESDYKISFELNITSESENHIDIFIGGKKQGENQKAICTTDITVEGYDCVLTPYVTVNGLVTESIPATVGVYTVVIDYSVISETDFTWNSYIEIEGFGIINRY